MTKRGSGHKAYPSQMLIRTTTSMLQRIKRASAQKGQSISMYVRLSLIDSLQRDKQPEEAR